MNKKQLIEKYKYEYFCDFDIELFENRVITNNSLNLFCDIPYKNNKEKSYIYDLLDKLLRCFDFSFTLEFDNIKDLEIFTS